LITTESKQAATSSNRTERVLAADSTRGGGFGCKIGIKSGRVPQDEGDACKGGAPHDGYGRSSSGAPEIGRSEVGKDDEWRLSKIERGNGWRTCYTMGFVLKDWKEKDKSLLNGD